MIIFIHRCVKPVANMKKEEENLINVTKEMHI